jgi:hypothetical protein
MCLGSRAYNYKWWIALEGGGKGEVSNPWPPAIAVDVRDARITHGRLVLGSEEEFLCHRLLSE